MTHNHDSNIHSEASPPLPNVYITKFNDFLYELHKQLTSEKNIRVSYWPIPEFIKHDDDPFIQGNILNKLDRGTKINKQSSTPTTVWKLFVDDYLIVIWMNSYRWNFRENASRELEHKTLFDKFGRGTSFIILTKVSCEGTPTITRRNCSKLFTVFENDEFQ